jgi:hypothetical protein
VFGGYDAIPSNADLVRAGCPGPRDGDVLDNFELGAGSVPASRLTRPSFKLSIDGGRRFRRSAFSGSSTTRFTVALRRRSVHVRYRHLKVVR